MSREVEAAEDARSRIEERGWTVVTWNADRYDSTVYTVHRALTGKDVTVTLMATSAEGGVHCHLDAIVSTDGEVTERADIEDGMVPGGITPEVVEAILTRGMDGWSSAPGTLSALSGNLGAELALPLSRLDVLAPAQRSVYLRFEATRIRQEAEVGLESLGRDLFRESTRIEQELAALEARHVGPTRGRAVLDGRLPTILPMVIAASMLLLISYVTMVLFSWVLDVAVSVAAVGGIGFGGGEILLAWYGGRRWRPGTAERTALPGVVCLLLAIVILPAMLYFVFWVGTSAGVPFSTFDSPTAWASRGGGLVLALSVAVAALLVAAVAAFAHTNQSQAESRADLRARLEHLRLEKASLEREYTQRASVLQAEARERIVTHLRDSAVYDTGEEWWNGLDLMPTAAWLDDLRAPARP